jgi:uncharacterized protein DUF1707/uncharacterized protein DUF4190
LAGNESQWPAQYPGNGWHASTQGPDTVDDGPPTAAQEQPAAAQPTAAQAPQDSVPQDSAPQGSAPQGSPPPPAAKTPPATPFGPPAGAYGHQSPGYQAPGYQAPGYHAPPAWPPVPHIPPGGYQVPPAGYQAPAGGYQVQGRMAPGMMHPGMMNAGMRAAATDRERAVDVLKAGFAEGRLTQEEYNFRMDRAYNAKTYGELAALTADLPAGAMPTVWPVPVYQPPVTTNSLARASLVLGVAEFFTMGLTAIPAIICGHMAKREMRQTGQRGDGLATSGLVLGYMAVIFWGVLIALSIVAAMISATGTGG